MSRRTFLAAGGAAATSLAMGDALGRLAGAPEAAAAGDVAGTVRLTEASVIQLALAPGRDRLVINVLGTLWSLPVSGGEARRLTGLYTDPAYPTWSPNGDRIAFQSYLGGTFHIWSIRPDGSGLRQHTSGGYDDREPAYSPDGGRIAFASDRSGAYDVWILDLASGALTQITHAAAGTSSYQPAWSPDGARIVYVEATPDEQRINTIAASGQGSPETLYAHAEGTVHSPSWSPDGQRIAYTHHDPATAGGVRDEGAGYPRLMVGGQAVTDGEDVFTFPAQWLAGDRLLYAADGKIRDRHLTTGAVRTIPFAATVSFRRTAYRRKRHDFDSRSRQPVRGIANPVLSPDGRTVAFVALNQLWTMRIGRRPVQLTDDVYYKATPFWSPDGSRLAYSSDRDGPEAIYVRDLRTGRERRLTGPFAGAQVRGAWSPDGRRIAFLSSIDGTGNAATYVADVESGQIRRILEPLFEPGRPTWGPDGTIVALAAHRPYSSRFREGRSLILTVDVTTGETAWHEPYEFNTINNRKGDCGPVWSPDGRHMAYVFDDVLWVLPVDERGAPAGEQRQVTEENADAVSWAGDSRTLLYLSNGRLRRVAAAGGRPETVPVDLSWRPDVPSGITVIRAGALWDGVRTGLERNVDVVVAGNRIAAVSERRSTADHRRRYGSRIRFVDAADLTVIPGLWESHGHEQLDQPYVGGRKGRLMLSLGVTSVMSMGDPAYEALEQRESEQAGARLTPRYFWSPETVDGERIYYDFMRATANERSLDRELERIAALRPDIVKTYVRLRNDWQEQAIDAGHEIGAPSFSHYTWPALAFGQDGCSHFATQRLGYQLSVSTSRTAYDDTIQLYARSQMALTQTSMSMAIVGTYPGILDDPRMRNLLTPWQYSALRAQVEAELTPADESSSRRFTQNHVRILRAGGIILGGTDEPLGLNDWGLQPTLAGFVRFGFTPYEALRTVTALPAKVMGVERDLGTVERGKLADLCLVRGNPLRDIRDAINVELVMKNGRLFSVDELIEPYADNDLDALAAAGPEEFLAAPECADHTGGGCC